MNSNIQCTSAILLAGGKSQRAETIKGLRQINDNYWLDIQIEYLVSLGIKHVFVGLGFDNKEYLSKSKLLKKYEYVINPNPEYGSFSTFQSVLKKAIEIKDNRILLMHIDHALPKSTTIAKLIENSKYDVVKPTYHQKSGHPIILSYKFCKTLIRKPYYAQLNTEIQNLNLEQIFWVEVDDKNIHENFNTKDKWQNYKNNLK